MRQVFSNTSFNIILFIGFINSLTFSALPATLSLYSDQVLFPDLTETKLVSRNVGIMLTFLGISSVITQGFLLRRFVARLGERGMVTIGQITFILSFAGMPLLPNPIYATVFLMLFAFSRGISDPPLQSLVTRYGNEKNQGRLLGLFQSAISLGLIFGPIWAGYVFDNIAPKAVFQVGAMIVVPGLLAALALRKRPVEHAPV